MLGNLCPSIHHRYFFVVSRQLICVKSMRCIRHRVLIKACDGVEKKREKKEAFGLAVISSSEEQYQL
jgi:hypothetical protein